MNEEELKKDEPIWDIIKGYDKESYKGHFKEVFSGEERFHDLIIMLKRSFQKGKLQALADVFKILKEFKYFGLIKLIKQSLKKMGDEPTLMECKSCRKVLAYNKDGLCNKCKEKEHE